METHISQAIIMRIKEFGESDLLITFFTSDKGRLKGVAKGAQRSRRRFVNCLDLFCLTNLEYALKKKGDLFFLNSGKLLHAFPGLRSDFFSLSLASYMVELAELLFPQGVVDPQVFALLRNSFYALEGGDKMDVLRIMFEAKAMSLGGYGINLERCCRCGRAYTGVGRAVFLPNLGAIACLNCEKEIGPCPGMGPDAVKWLAAMQSQSWVDLEHLDLREEDVRGLRKVLNLHMEYRLGKKMKAAKYLE